MKSSASTFDTTASRRARANFARNRAALASHQPTVSLSEIHTTDEWLFARDRSLTRRDPQTGRWLAECSVPRRAAIEIFRKLDVAGPVACFLQPQHAAQIRVVLDRLEPQQAVIAVVADDATLATMLCCEDFTEDVAAHRLWFAAGAGWPEQLAQLLRDRPGLPIPSQFIRLPHAADQLHETIAAAQQVFSTLTGERAETLAAARQAWPARTRSIEPRLCVLAPSRFRLWNDAGATLAAAIGDGAARVNHDDPATSSPMALVRAVADRDSLVAADVFRADLPNVLPDGLPWLTWVTTPRVPAFVSVGKNDQLLLADPALQPLALDSGWPTDRLHIARPPVQFSPPQRVESLAIVADTAPTTAPEALAEYSSHVVLWEQIAHELGQNSLALGDRDLHRYLADHMRRLDVSADDLQRARFIHDLIIPAFQQSLARLLIRHRLPLQLHGRGWDRISEFAAHAAGPVQSRQQLDAILASPVALVRAWPASIIHPIDSLGLPLLRLTRDAKTFIAAATRALSQNPSDAASSSPRHDHPTLNLELILSLLTRVARGDRGR